MIVRYYQSIFLSSYLRDKFIVINLLGSLVINFSLWIYLVWQTKSFGDLVTLHYNIYFGIDWLGPWYQIFLLPSLGLAFFLINFMIGAMVYQREKILSYFLAGTSSLVQLIFSLAATFIISINF